MADNKALKELFHEQLKDIYFAERVIYKTLPKMAEAAKARALKDAFNTHQAQTKEHLARLEQVFQMIGQKPDAKTCEAINGIIAEGEETIQKFGSTDVIDTGLIAAAEAVEHYEMTRYGTLIAWAKQLGRADCANVLQQNLDEEKAADAKLNSIAESNVNAKAAA